VRNSPQYLTSPGAAFSFIQAAGREERVVRGAPPAAQRHPPSPAPSLSPAPTRLPDIEVGVQDVSAGGRALAELLLGHGTQVLSRQLLERLPDLRQPVLVLRPQDPLLHVAGAPVRGVCGQRVSAAEPGETQLTPQQPRESIPSCPATASPTRMGAPRSQLALAPRGQDRRLATSFTSGCFIWAFGAPLAPRAIPGGTKRFKGAGVNLCTSNTARVVAAMP